MLIRCLLLIVVLIPNAHAETRLEAAMRAELQRQQLTGLVWATVSSEGTRSGALGVADTRSGAPLLADSRVEVGSLTKTLMALAVMRAASLGLLDLEEPVSQRLPALPIVNVWATTHPLRLRHLLDMSSGLDDTRLWQFADRRMRPDTPLLTILQRDPNLLRVRTPPGTQFSYSNTGFLLAAAVLEAAAGERYESWARRTLLRPLGLMATDFDPDAAGVPVGHLDDATTLTSPPVGVRPAARLVTTASDMARLLQFLLGDGTLNGQPFISPGFWKQRGLAETDAWRAGLRSGYGLGLSTRDRHGAVGLCHGGSIAGWRAMLCAYPQAQAGFFVAFNQDREDARYDAFDAMLVHAIGVSTPAHPELAGPIPEAERSFSGLYTASPSRLSQTMLIERLFDPWRLDLHSSKPTLRQGWLGAPRPLARVGPGLYRQHDRQQATLVLSKDTSDAPGQSRVLGSYVRLRPLPVWEWGVLALAASAGVLGLLASLVAAPWLRWRRGEALARTPLFGAALACIAAAGLLALQPWQALGEATLTNIMLAAASLALLPASLWQLWRGSRWAQAAALGVLTGIALLAAFGLWPVLLWRL
ncbi:MAG TPA: serine hydrolase domain-containing protein [Rubrivivax sp.]|nr:serine hydrolase domain-containing protein [Rubrivivax sp.]